MATKLIEVGNDVIEFPADMSDADIEKVLASQFAPKQAPVPTQEPKKSSFWEEAGRQLGLTARAGVSGIAGLPNIVADPAVALYNRLAGTNYQLPSQALQATLTSMGLPEPKNRLERAVQAGASAMAGTGGQAQLAQMSGSAMAAPFTKELGQQLAAAGMSGTAAQATSERAAEVGFSPAANVAATLAAGTLAGLAGAKGARIATTEKVTPTTVDAIKQEATRAYNRVDQAGVSIKPIPVLKTIDDIEQNLLSTANFNPRLPTHQPIVTILEQMRDMVGQQRVSFSKMDQLRQTAVDLARESKEPATRRLASMVVSGLDDKITTLQPNELLTGRQNLAGAVKDITEARDAWKRMSKASVLEDALNVAEARALDPKASEGELIRTQFKNLAANKNKMRMFTKDEQEAIRKVVSGDAGQTMLSLLARFNPERNQLVAGAQFYGVTQNPMYVGIPAAGFLSDKALAVIQRRAAEDVRSQILQGKVQRPRDTAGWRALVEARSREIAQEEAPQPTE